jgi:uncharacterized protein (DUF433 family)
VNFQRSLPKSAGCPRFASQDTPYHRPVPHNGKRPFPVAVMIRAATLPAVATGKPCIRNLRFPVSRLLGLLAARESRESILSAYPYLEAADIDEALRYAASLSEDETIELSR